MFFNVFIKLKKHVFLCFFICKVMFLTSMNNSNKILVVVVVAVVIIAED